MSNIGRVNHFGTNLLAFVGDDVSVDDVSLYFSDPDGDRLTYTATSSDTDLATASVSGFTVTVTGVAEGSATITVTAMDPGGLSATQSFDVTVDPRSLGACAVGMELNPGESCSVGSDRFEVLADGRGRFGPFSAGQSIRINRFSASRISGTDRWRINSVP